MGVGTPSAFSPAYFSSAKVDEIISGANVSAFVDGVRIRRSLDITGTTFQELIWNFSIQANWSGVFDVSKPLSSVRIDGVAAGSESSRDMNFGNNARRCFTWSWTGHGSQRGFSFGSSINFGNNSLTSFLYEFGNENHALPYSEVYVRQ